MSQPQNPNQVVRQLRGRMVALEEALADRDNQLKQHQQTVRRLEKWIERASKRIKYIEDIPGKRVPYFLNFEIEIPPQVNQDGAAVTVRGQTFHDVQPISMDGPFICTQYLAAFRAKTYSLGPTQTRANDQAAGTEVFTPLTGRFRPIASTADPFSGAYIGPAIGGQAAADATLVNTFRPGTIDFLFEVKDDGTNRLRQNDIRTPSRYLFSEFDRPLYMPVSDFFARGSSVRINVSPTRELGLVEFNYVAYNGIAPGDEAPMDPEASDNGRVVFAIGGTLTFTMLGYKILQAQTPAV